MAKEAQLEATAIQTVGTKGYDGFAIAIVGRAIRQEPRSSSVEKRLHHPAPAEHEGVGDMLQRRNVDIGLAGADDLGEALVKPRIFRLGLLWTMRPSIASLAPPLDSSIWPASVSAMMSQLCGPVCSQSRSIGDRLPSAVRNSIWAATGASRFSGKSSVAAVMNIGGRMCVAIDSALMPGSNTPKPPALPDPVLARMPAAHILLPDDRGRTDPGHGEEGARGLDGRRVARMPAGEQRDAFRRGQRLQILDLADRGAGRLFQEHMLAGLERRASRLVADLRRHAERHGVEIACRREHRLDRREIRDAVHRGVAAGGGDELVVGVFGERRQMLVADDLADADDAKPDGRFA